MPFLGLLIITGSGAYDRGMAKGSVQFKVSNQPADPEGNPIEGPPADKFTATGTGMVTIKFGKKLTGTVGLTVLPNGEIQYEGEIALPPRVELFDALDVKHSLIDPDPLKINLIGIPRVRVYAVIDGELRFEAGLGPGTLENAKVHIQFNPDHQEETVIEGNASFVVPAHAALVLEVNLGIGAEALVVEARGTIDLIGEAGIKGEARLDVPVRWTPLEGLSVDGKVKATGQPYLAFRIKGTVKILLDLWLKTVTIWKETFDLADFEFGSSLTVSAELPVTYNEADGFNADFGRLKLTYPDINTSELVKGIVKELV
jgi:hypothetical protein